MRVKSVYILHMFVANSNIMSTSLSVVAAIGFRLTVESKHFTKRL